mmetsp:Transcript_7172/g.13713  ORF Transcript_7172/g.13713 Transcript_7172/m.13713 type:complete len:105 (-) Transcript_7172:46-360(-)|eukprot:scaffold7945_cov92-Amphora_coffeaeformis.AAC.2
MAQDGRVYERSAMERHVVTSQTNKAMRRKGGKNQVPRHQRPHMGDTLLPAQWIKNHIQTLIADKMITGRIGGCVEGQGKGTQEQGKNCCKKPRMETRLPCTMSH